MLYPKLCTGGYNISILHLYLPMDPSVFTSQGQIECTEVVNSNNLFVSETLWKELFFKGRGQTRVFLNWVTCLHRFRAPLQMDF